MDIKPIIKKYLRFALYSIVNAFILSSGLTLFFTAGLNFFTPSSQRTNIFSVNSVSEINPIILILLIFGMVTVFFVFFCFKDKVYRFTVPVSVLIFALLVITRSKNEHPYLAIILALTAVSLIYIYKEIFPEKDYKLFEGKNLYILTGILTLFMITTVTIGCIARMYAFNTATYDFGIFAQMFESMATDLTQTTTLERGKAMSHLEVHFSPIYYLLLPFYMLFRRPEFLLAAQAAVCFSGIIPLLLLCRHYKYNNTSSFLAGVIFLCYPAFTCACFYDFHENVFLVPLILWLMYFIERGAPFRAVIFGILLLCVKEDAGVYLIVAALYTLLNKKASKPIGIMLLIMGAIGFLAATALINSLGEGIMVGRYRIFLARGQSSLIDVVLNALKNPAFFFSKLLDEKKLLFIVEMLLPLMFIPIRSRRVCDWVLFVPMVLYNLATEYSYQSDIHFQYVFGTGAFLMFLFVKNFRYEKKKNKTAVAAVLASAICLTGASTPKYYNLVSVAEQWDYFQSARTALAEIPRDARVFASTYLTPYLYDCREVYMYPPIYNAKNLNSPDYVVLDSRPGALKEYEEIYDACMESGYEKVSDDESFVVVLKAPRG